MALAAGDYARPAATELPLAARDSNRVEDVVDPMVRRVPLKTRRVVGIELVV